MTAGGFGWPVGTDGYCITKVPDQLIYDDSGGWISDRVMNRIEIEVALPLNKNN